MNNQTNFTNTLINIVDSRPVYLGIGIILFTYAIQTEIVQKAIGKILNK